ncbi:SETMAR [Cordylochernes scorpioides]|uniref:SETMAR n=1 Tax=Cordylochernes scorpioides TaxID=51811 RepID=A0ABY6KJ44_9ARAC|nr:SETMAR [Cordylochernes scorpioides]
MIVGRCLALLIGRTNEIFRPDSLLKAILWWCSVEREGAIAPLVSHISEFPVHAARGSRHRNLPYRAVPYLSTVLRHFIQIGKVKNLDQWVPYELSENEKKSPF